MPDQAPGDDVPLGEVRDWLREQAENGGAHCPACTQFTKVYRRKINSGMARALIAMYQHAGTDWLHKPTALRGLGAAARDESLLRYWGLVEEAAEQRPDGGRAGWWRVTDRGKAFVLGQLQVPSHARTFDSRCLGLVGELVSIRTVLGDRFDYDELMSS